MERRHSALLLAAAAVLAYALLSACSTKNDGATPSGSATPANTQPPGSSTAVSTAPEAALRLYVQRRLSQGFVEDCDDAKRPDDVGKQCARKLGERNGLIAYTLGPTFGDYTRIMILEQQDGAWTIAYQETHDPDEPPVPGVPWPLEVGANVVVAGTAPDCLKIRQEPAITGQELGCIDDGTAVRVVAGPVDADDIEWWQLEGQGWAAANYLRYPDASTPEPTEQQ